MIEATRNCDDLRCYTRLEKANKSVTREINWSTSIGLSFNHIRAVGTRMSEKKILKLWFSVVKHALEERVYFKNDEINESPCT